MEHIKAWYNEKDQPLRRPFGGDNRKSQKPSNASLEQDEAGQLSNRVTISQLSPQHTGGGFQESLLYDDIEFKDSIIPLSNHDDPNTYAARASPFDTEKKSQRRACNSKAKTLSLAQGSLYF
jgi:hypothetical protein